MSKTNLLLFWILVGVSLALLPAKANAASDDDKKFLAMAAQSDQNEIALSKLAEQKATNPAVKAFAGKMVTEQAERCWAHRSSGPASRLPFAGGTERCPARIR